MTNTDFLPQDYETPVMNNYMKFQKGENRFRILSKPIVGWLDWEDKKPIRFKMDHKPDAPIDPSKPIKHFWAMVVFNYATDSVQVLEITQKTIHKAITDLSKDKDWGSPLEYDLKVMKTGEGMDTEYSVVPVPAKPIGLAIQEAYENKPVNLNALYEGKDPFEV